MKMLMLGALALSTLAAPAMAEDANRGRELTLRWCVACHVVDEATQGGDAGPAFASLVNRMGRTDAELRVWLSAPHPPMPEMNLSSLEIDDIIAHLATLRN